MRVIQSSRFLIDLAARRQRLITFQVSVALNKIFSFYCPSFWSFPFLKWWDGHENRSQPNDQVFSSTPPRCFQCHSHRVSLLLSDLLQFPFDTKSSVACTDGLVAKVFNTFSTTHLAEATIGNKYDNSLSNTCRESSNQLPIWPNWVT